MATCAIFVSLASSWGDRWTEHVKRYATHHLLVRERYFFILSFFVVAAPQNRHLCLFQLFWYCAVCLFVISASSSSASFQFSFMHNQKMDGEETQGIQKKLTFIWHVIDVKGVTFNDWPTYIYQMYFEGSLHSTEGFMTFQPFVLAVRPAASPKTPQNHNISENKLLKK